MRALIILIIPLELFAASDLPVESKPPWQVMRSDKQVNSFAPVQDQPVGLSIETGLAVVWSELIHDLGAERDYLGLTSSSGDFDESGLALASQNMDTFLIGTVQTYDLSNPSRILSETRFRFSGEALQRLREDGIPENIVQQLALLGDRKFSQEAMFWETVENQIGREHTQQYRQVILEHTGGSGASDESITQTTPWHLTEQSLDNLETWNEFLYYPRIAKQVLAYQSRRATRKRSVNLLEEDDSLFDVLGFFKRWGIPKPVTVIILALALYLLLALLARH